MATTTTRFAPSPTGLMHLGNARAALFNWLIARHDGGRFLVRIEDTDTARAVPGGTDAILADLDWIGLTADEEPAYQSGRTAEHADALARLAAGGHLYPCFCTEDALKAARRAQQRAGKPPRYPGTCRSLDEAESRRRVADGERHTSRFRVPAGHQVEFTDRVHGPQRFASDDIGDFVVVRGDGNPVFFFANALDDAAAGVTLVLRGDDHLSNTPRQMLLLAALGLPAPEYGHVPLLHDAGGGPLSKRAGALSVGALRDLGYHPLALANYLARVGGHVASGAALPLVDLARAFDPLHLGRAAARYDEDQLKHWQRQLLDSLDADALWDWMGAPVHERVPPERRDAFIALVRPNALFPGDALDWAFVLFDDEPMPQKQAVERMQAEDAALFAHARTAYADGIAWDAWSAAVRAAAGVKGRALYAPLRAALTGRLDGPELAGVFAMLTPEQVKRRLERAEGLARR